MTSNSRLDFGDLDHNVDSGILSGFFYHCRTSNFTNFADNSRSSQRNLVKLFSLAKNLPSLLIQITLRIQEYFDINFITAG